MVGVALLASLTLAGPAQEAPERLCRPQPAPPRSSRIEHYMAVRRQFGFRSDEAYVRKLIGRGMWESDVGFIPVTPAEDRYLRLRDRLVLGARVDRLLRRHPHLSGGVSVEDDWPRGPYLLVRVTRDAVRYERVLRRLARFPRNLRTMKVARSYRSLRRLQHRIDFRAHEPDGFHVSAAGVDVYRNRVRIEVITRRTDAEAYFRARYGPGVTTDVIATELTSPACAGLFDYRPAPDGRSITVGYEAGGGARFDRFELVEHADRVEIAIVVQRSNGPVTSDSRRAEATVPLSAPLGSRHVVDAVTGRRLAAGA